MHPTGTSSDLGVPSEGGVEKPTVVSFVFRLECVLPPAPWDMTDEFE